MKVEKLVATLDVPSGAERQRLERPGLHGVVPVLMGVEVFSKSEESTIDELDGLDSNHGSWDQRSGDAVLGREAIDPERHNIDDLTHTDTWEADVYLDYLHVH